jgi:hypothetical protein
MIMSLKIKEMKLQMQMDCKGISQISLIWIICAVEPK